MNRVASDCALGVETQHDRVSQPRPRSRYRGRVSDSPFRLPPGPLLFKGGSIALAQVVAK